MKKILTTIFLLLFCTNVLALEYKPGKKHLDREGVVGLLLYLNGKMFEHVFKPNLSACMKSKRIASREIDAHSKEGRVVFACKILVADLEEDTQTKYGLRIVKVHSGGEL